ncbi:MAG: tRNA epoxyqueuosine(34) reductase QueG [Bryobacteraceae bacterium]
MPSISSERAKQLAAECGFELAGVTRAEPSPDRDRYLKWTELGMAGAMSYLADRRAHVRTDPKLLLPSARSILCVGKLYNSAGPYSTECETDDGGWISRYAWGQDYHDVLRRGLERLVERLREYATFEWKICVDTAPLLERSYARQAGLGWIGKNTCLINQRMGSWFFLGELLVSLELAADAPAPDRCGTCTRCIDACPTQAIVPDAGGWTLDARRCISYFTIELRGTIPEEHRGGIGRNLFGCDICQDVCPWNRRAPVTEKLAFAPPAAPFELAELANLSSGEFHRRFQNTPVERARYSGFLRNVAVAMGNSKLEKYREPLKMLAGFEDEQVATHARWALEQLG